MNLFAFKGGAMSRRTSVLAVALALTASVAYLAGSAAGSGAGGTTTSGERTAIPGFSRVVFLSHANDPVRTPVFPGDPPFSLTTKFTVHDDGFYLQYIKEGEHTGTHYSGPCHFHVAARCADELDPGDFILPAVVVDVRARVHENVDFQGSVAYLKKWQGQHRGFPKKNALLLWARCDRWGGARGGGGRPPSYKRRSAGGRG